MRYDAIILGRGPAGVSCALYTVRANLKTLVIGKLNSNLLKAEKIENYYGLETPVNGKTLLEIGENQIKRLGVEIVEDEAVGLEKEEHFTVTTVNGKYEALTVLIATGSPVVKAPVKGLEAYEGRGVSYCTTCDGFFYRKKRVGVLGFNDYAIHEAMELLPFTQDITLFTNGKELELSPANREKLDSFTVVTKKVKSLYGEELIEGVVLEDDTKVTLDGLFVAYGSASGADFALKMGIATDSKTKAILTDAQMQTNIPGLFAAGDVTGGFKQVSVAVGQGALAARRMIEEARAKRT